MRITVMFDSQQLTQIVISPENDRERALLKSIPETAAGHVHHDSSYYECRGGWMRPTHENSALVISLKDPDPKETPK